MFPVIFMLCGCSSLPSSSDRWWGADKLQHFMVSAIIAAAVADQRDGRHSDCNAAGTGFSSAITVGAAKEWYDQNRGGSWSHKDLSWDGLGALVGAELAADCF
ncbi:MAG TPA: hypothetical protein EYN73_04860 [Chromatiaceae bacterium]|jgi:putative lipoprotein|nr:hypothetical protein [Chromatiaceae bacterium]HIA08399.1 hypothetical protein [Chromatiaceae bacterium]HIN81949.1 hypothetical protein [Chromatiales bacterium]HIO55034.1 hypothetical protein [Chromatiales bacterium]